MPRCISRQILGRSQEQVLGQVWEQGESVFVAELAAQLAYHAPGEVGYFTFVFQPLRDKDGQISRISCVALDVTAQVHVRQQVQDLNEELAAINEELMASYEELGESNRQLTRTNVDLDTFICTASHDLKAPITNIESIVLALRGTLPAAVQQDELVAHLLDLLNQTVARFQFIIGQLTDISRLQLAHAGVAEPVYLADVVAHLRLDLAPALTAAGTQLTVEVAPDLVVSFSRLIRARWCTTCSATPSSTAPSTAPRIPAPAHPRRGHRRGPLHHQAPREKRRGQHRRAEPAEHGHHLYRYVSCVSLPAPSLTYAGPHKCAASR